jgi:hypothetical protein
MVAMDSTIPCCWIEQQRWGGSLFTRDADFLAIAAARQAAGSYFCGVAYAKQGEATFRQCIDDLEFLAECGDLRDVANQVYFIPLH